MMNILFSNILSTTKRAKTGTFRFCTFFYAGIFSLSTILFTSGFCVTAAAQEYQVTVYTVNVREGPGTSYEIIGSLQEGERISSEETRTDAEGNFWYLVSYNEMDGYILADLVEDSTNPVEEETPDDDANVTAESAEDPVLSEDPQSGEQETGEPVDTSSDGEELETPGEETLQEDSEKEPSEDETEEETAEDTEPDIEQEEDPELTEDLSDEEETELDSLYVEADQPSWSGYVQSEAEFEAQLASFPESYQAGIRSVHAVYPNYTFSADYIDMDFQELVNAQVGKKISSYYQPSWKAMYDESFGYLENYNWETGEWYNSEGMFTYASREVIEYFTDPRNFLDPSNIYMFMRQSYSEEQTVDDLRSLLAGSFLSKGYIPNSEEENDVRLKGDYAEVIMEAARFSGTSPFVLAASILLEHGYNGGTPLISGYYKADDGTEYKKYYNYFDIGATGSDNNNVIQNGLEYSKAQGWISPYLSIVNGAQWTADSYISNGQDTYYYKENNVINGWDSLWHQYSTGIMTAYSSAGLMRNAFADKTYAALDFRIPVYQNMTSAPVEEPARNDNLNNYYFTDMQASGLEPDFSMSNRDYAMTVTGDTLLEIAVPQWAEYQSPMSFALHQGENLVELDVMSQTGYLRTYNITVLAAADCTLQVKTYEGDRLRIADSPGDAPAVMWGDINGDGKVSALDYIAIKNHIMGTTILTEEAALAAADVNGDGKISALDYIEIKNYIMEN